MFKVQNNEPSQNLKVSYFQSPINQNKASVQSLIAAVA